MTIVFTSTGYACVSENCSFSFANNWTLYIFEGRMTLLSFKKEKKVNGSPCSFVRKCRFTSGEFRRWRKSSNFFNARALVMCQVMGRKGVSCNTMARLSNVTIRNSWSGDIRGQIFSKEVRLPYQYKVDDYMMKRKQISGFCFVNLRVRSNLPCLWAILVHL